MRLESCSQRYLFIEPDSFQGAPRSDVEVALGPLQAVVGKCSVALSFRVEVETIAVIGWSPRVVPANF